MHRTVLASLLSAAALCASTPAQSPLVVPPGAAAREGNSGGVLAGFHARFRQQILVRSDLLQAMQNKDITALWFRRNDTLGKAFPQFAAQMRVTLSHAARATTAPSARF